MANKFRCKKYYRKLQSIKSFRFKLLFSINWCFLRVCDKSMQKSCQLRRQRLQENVISTHSKLTSSLFQVKSVKHSWNQGENCQTLYLIDKATNIKTVIISLKEKHNMEIIEFESLWYPLIQRWNCDLSSISFVLRIKMVCWLLC